MKYRAMPLVEREERGRTKWRPGLQCFGWWTLRFWPWWASDWPRWGGQRPRRKESWKHKLHLIANLHPGDELECSLTPDTVYRTFCIFSSHWQQIFLFQQKFHLSRRKHFSLKRLICHGIIVSLICGVQSLCLWVWERYKVFCICLFVGYNAWVAPSCPELHWPSDVICAIEGR